MNEDEPLNWSSAQPIFGDDRFPPLSSLVAMHFGARSHPGHRQAINTDHYMVARFGRFRETLASSLPPGAAASRFDESGFGMVVADGMGPGSEYASRLAISTLSQLALQFGRWNVRVNEYTAWEIVQRAERFYQRVDETVSEASHQHPGLLGMSTTLTATYSGG